MKKPVSFFLCEYETSDGFGHLLAFLSFTPPFIVAIQTAVYCTLLLCSSISQSAQISVASGVAGKLLLGQLTNEASNLLLKNIIKQPRPFSNSHNYTYTDYGMPSSHSQFMAFLVAIWPFLVERLFRFLQWPRIWELAFQLTACMGTFLIAYGRLYLEYHTPVQVFVGLAIGYAFGHFWLHHVIKSGVTSKSDKTK